MTAADSEDQVQEIVDRLAFEEDQLRRDQMDLSGDLGDKERMIVMQQRKIAALDEANGRLVAELNRLGERLGGGGGGGGNNVTQVTVNSGDPNVTVTTMSPTKSHQNLVEDETPKTVEQLLDSLHSTPI